MLLPVLPGLQAAGLAPLLYLALITFVVATALCTRDPDRRATALQVLQLLLPGRRSKRPIRKGQPKP